MSGFEELRKQAEAEAEAEVTRAREEQIHAGRCNVRPLPAVATRPFRSELTLEKNTIFVSNQHQGDWHQYEHQINHPDSDEPVIRRVTVGKENPKDRGRGVLTQVHQDVFYKLLGLWSELGYPLLSPQEKGRKSYGVINATRYRIVTTIRGAENDRLEDYQRVQQILRDLAATPVVLENVYTWQGFQEREIFTLLGEVRWSEHGKRGEHASILLSSFVTEGFLRKNVKILLGEPYERLRGRDLGKRRGAPLEIARLLYPFLDTQLATKDEYHARLDHLAERFGFTRYRYKSETRRKFTPSVRALDGKLIQLERYRLRVSLQLSKDGTDFVLVARREPNEDSAQLGLFKGEKA